MMTHVETLPVRKSSADTMHPGEDFFSAHALKKKLINLEMLMNQADITVHDRPVVDAALTESERTDGPAAALELPDARS